MHLFMLVDSCHGVKGVATLLIQTMVNLIDYQQCFKVGDKVQLSYCDDTTVYEIDKTKFVDNRHVYHLLDVQGWKAGINLMRVVPGK